jgi:hypothetical protein
MSKVEFQYSPKRGGKTVPMALRYAETLRRMGHGTYADGGYQTRMLTAGAPAEVPAEPLASAAILEFAKENGVDIDKVVGTGKDGRIKKSDVEAFIDVRDLT